MKHTENTSINISGVSSNHREYWHPDIIGYYELSYMKLGLKERPGFIKRLFMKHLLGFMWNDLTN